MLEIKKTCNYIIGWLATTLLFLLYIQYSPGMGNVWYRNNEYFSPMGAINVILFPLQNYKMWNMHMWDINYFIWVLFGFILMWGIHYYYITI